MDAWNTTSLIVTPPPPPPPPRSPEYAALMARLRREQEEREYRALVAPAPTRGGDNDDDDGGDDDEEVTWREVRSQVSVIFNILLSTLASAAAVVGDWARGRQAARRGRGERGGGRVGRLAVNPKYPAVIDETKCRVQM